MARAAAAAAINLQKARRCICTSLLFALAGRPIDEKCLSRTCSVLLRRPECEALCASIPRGSPMNVRASIDQLPHLAGEAHDRAKARQSLERRQANRSRSEE